MNKLHYVHRFLDDRGSLEEVSVKYAFKLRPRTHAGNGAAGPLDEIG
jgi:hypothetical protein